MGKKNYWERKWILRKRKKRKKERNVENGIWGHGLTLGPPLTTICHMQTAWVQMRCCVTWRLTWIQAVWHSDNIITNFERQWSPLKIEADRKFRRRQFIWRLRVKQIRVAVNDDLNDGLRLRQSRIVFIPKCLHSHNTPDNSAWFNNGSIWLIR